MYHLRIKSMGQQGKVQGSESHSATLTRTPTTRMCVHAHTHTTLLKNGEHVLK